MPAVLKEHLKNLRQVIGDQNLLGVLTFFRGKPYHPRKVKRYCRPEVGGRESGQVMSLTFIGRPDYSGSRAA